MKLSDGALAFWQRILRKLSQRSTVASVIPALGLFGLHFNQGKVALILQTICGVATVGLFLLDDPQVRYVLTGKLPDAEKPPTVPQPFDSNAPDKG